MPRRSPPDWDTALRRHNHHQLSVDPDGHDLKSGPSSLVLPGTRLVQHGDQLAHGALALLNRVGVIRISRQITVCERDPAKWLLPQHLLGSRLTVLAEVKTKAG